jgi:spore coat polysaccharide biosynthesis protein SpsF (cytidylyltransferase family)
MREVMVRKGICRTDVRLDLDYPEDIELIRRIYEALYKGKPIPLEEVYQFLDSNPELILINKFRVHTEGNYYAHRLLYGPLSKD